MSPTSSSTPFEPGSSPRPWTLRVHPQQDELLLSWMVRMAAINRTDLHTVLGLPSKDCKYPASLTPQHYDRLVRISALPASVFHAMVVDPEDQARPKAYAGLLEDNASRPKAKVLGVQIIQHCPLCLQEDQIPYFRRAWCFDTTVVCDRHPVRLRSTCAVCGQGWRPVTRWGGMSSHSTCSRCTADLRQSTPDFIPEALHERLVAFQRHVLNLQLDARVSLGRGAMTEGIRYAQFVQHLLSFIRLYGLHALFDPETWDLRVREDARVTALPLAEQRLRAVSIVVWCLEDLGRHLPTLAGRVLSPRQHYRDVAALRQYVRDDLRGQWLMHRLANAYPVEGMEIILTWFPALSARKANHVLEDRMSVRGKVTTASRPAFQLTDAQWAVAASVLPVYGHAVRPGKHEARVLFEGMLHFLSSGTPWRELPSAFPLAVTVANALQRWRASGVLTAILTRLFEALHLEGGVILEKHACTPERTPPEWRALADAFLAPRMIEELRRLNPRLHYRLVEIFITQEKSAER